MIQDTKEINNIKEANKYDAPKKMGRPAGITKDKMKINPDIKLGRPNATQYDIFDPHKKVLKKKTDKPRGQHLNRVIRYEIQHNQIKYLFSTILQIEKEFGLSTAVVMRVIRAHDRRNNGKELSLSDNRVFENYPKFISCVKLPYDKTKKIVGVIRYDSKLNRNDLVNLKLKIDVPTK